MSSRAGLPWPSDQAPVEMVVGDMTLISGWKYAVASYAQ